jgi:hypothetical protein
MTRFEEVSDEVNKDRITYETTQECCIEWVKGDKTATVTFPGSNRYNSKIRKLAEEHPEDVQIRHDNQDGSLIATLPVKYVKISRPATKEMTEEQKQAVAERMREIRAKLR